MERFIYQPHRIESPFYFRTVELLIVVAGLLFWSFSSRKISTLIFVVIVPILIVLFMANRRAIFINKGLRYDFIENKIELYVDGVLYRKFNIDGCTYKVETVFGKSSIVMRNSIGNFFSSDSVVGFSQDLGKNSYEFLIYNTQNLDEIVQYIDNNSEPIKSE